MFAGNPEYNIFTKKTDDLQILIQENISMSSVPEILRSAKCITRCPSNPVLAGKDIPYESVLVYNAGITKFQGQYVMLFRNEYLRDKDGNKTDDKQMGNLKTNLGFAFSKDGINWDVKKKPFIDYPDYDRIAEAVYANKGKGEILRFYDPRLIVIEGRCYFCFAIDTKHGLRGGIGVTDDFENFEILSMTVPDNRNMVLFPEKIGGKYVRLERPFPVYSRGGKDRFEIWMSDSPDLRYWGNSDLVLAVEDVPFADDKIGPAAPPIKTDKGWLTVFHAVDKDERRGKNGWETKWQKRYTAGIMLLDLENPSKVIGMSRDPLIAPEVPYETEEGLRTQVIFPGGMILEDSGEVKIYYGAADTVECLATAHVDDLLALCKPV